MANKVMTTLEAQVAEQRWSDLQQAFADRAGQRPAALESNYLTQSIADPTVWRLVGIWRSREEFDQYRQSTPTVGGLLMFQAAGADPTMSIYEVKDS